MPLFQKKGAFMPPTNTNLTVLFNQMNLTGFWNVLFLHEKGFWNDYLKCKVHILMPALPCHMNFFWKIVVHAEKFKGICHGLKGFIFKFQSMDTHRPVSSLTKHPIYCASCKKNIFFSKT